MLRYRIIDKILRNRQKKFPSKNYIRDEVEVRLYGPDSNSISLSSIEKDIQDMRHDTSLGINAPIRYNRKENGYYYSDPSYSMDGFGLTEDDQQSLREAAGLLKLFSDYPVFSNLRVSIEKICTHLMLPGDLNEVYNRKYIHFEQGDPAGVAIKWIKPIYEAIVNRNEIEFDYIRVYQEGDVQRRWLEPYQLREKNNNWYVIGYTRKHNSFTTYALDRIQNLAYSGKTFLPTADFNETEIYKNSVGIMAGTGPAERVVLEVSGAPRLVLKFNPIHISQQILNETANTTRFELHVEVNEELVSSLLPFCRHLKVIEPGKLRQSLLEELKGGLENQTQLNSPEE